MEVVKIHHHITHYTNSGIDSSLLEERMMQADEGAGVLVGRGWAHDVYSGGRRVHRIDSITPHRDVREGGEGYMREGVGERGWM